MGKISEVINFYSNQEPVKKGEPVLKFETRTGLLFFRKGNKESQLFSSAQAAERAKKEGRLRWGEPWELTFLPDDDGNLCIMPTRHDKRDYYHRRY